MHCACFLFKQAEAKDIVQVLKQRVNGSNALGQLFVLFSQDWSMLTQHPPSKDSQLLSQWELQYFTAGQGMPIVYEEKGEELLNLVHNGAKGAKAVECK